MPQENQVLRCYSCLTFQVHLVKKQKKWQCKMCNSKQSLKQVYGRGSGKDCRLHVMKLNELQFSGHPIDDDCNEENVNELEVQHGNHTTETVLINDIKNESKWSRYMVKADETSDEEEEIGMRRKENYRIMENECSNRKKRKLNNGFAYSTSETNFELTGKRKDQSNVETEIENKKPEERFKKYDMTFYNGCSIESGSKWSAFIGREECSSDEECKSETEAVLINKIESSQNRSQDLPERKSIDIEKLDDGNRETCSTYSKYLVNTHSEKDQVPSRNEKNETGVLKILGTLRDDDDLDEILNI